MKRSGQQPPQQSLETHAYVQDFFRRLDSTNRVRVFRILRMYPELFSKLVTLIRMKREKHKTDEQIGREQRELLNDVLYGKNT